MKRRAFLKLAGKASAAVVAAPVLAKVPENGRPWNYYEDNTAVEAFGLAPIKCEGAAVKFDKNSKKARKRAKALAKAMRKTKEKAEADVLAKASS